MKRPLAVTRGHGHTAFRLRLQAQKIVELIKECAQ